MLMLMLLVYIFSFLLIIYNFTAMAQLDRKIRVSENSPKSQTSPTFEQLLKVEETYRSTNTSPTFRISHDGEEPLSPSHHNKKSVLTKVKERAKKLKYSLSGKRRFENDQSTHSTTPASAWGVTFDHYSDDDVDEKDPDPEYLGAPMYESEAAPETLKETARQHPRAVPVVSENHRVPNRMSLEAVPENEKPVSPNTTMSEAVSEKLGPAYNAMSDATHMIASKIAGLAVTNQETQDHEQETARNASQIAVPPSSESKKMSDNGGHLSPQTWDKGVSIKEYFLTKLEPGEDEKALSQAITEAISPTKASKDTGVVEKVKGAVSSLFWQEEISNMMKKSASLSSSAGPASSSVPSASQHRQIASENVHSSKAHHPFSANSSPVIPLSSNAYEVHEEENHGKILQAN